MRARRSAAAERGSSGIGVILAATLLLAGVARADDPVTVAAGLDRASITLGDPILLTLEVEASSGYRITPPTILRNLGVLEVLETLPVQQVPGPDGGTRLRFGYRITAFHLGEHVVPPIEVPYVDPAGGRAVVRTAPLAVHVESVIGPAEDASDIRPLKPQLEVPGGAGSRAWLIGFALALAAALAIAGRLLYRSRRRRSAMLEPAPASPAARALSEMQRIAELRLPEAGRYREHYELLAQVLRRYLAEQFGLPALQRTARELRPELERAGIDPRQAATIYEILRESEVVRFQRFEPYPRHAQEAVGAALELVRKVARSPEPEAALRT